MTSFPSSRIISPADRRVQFGRTPSPCFSDSSLPDEAGPSTPPFRTSALPGTIRIHSALALGATHGAGIEYDVSYEPSQARHRLHPRGTAYSPVPTAAVLAQPATEPPVSSMTIHVSEFPYVIQVTPMMDAMSPTALAPYSPIKAGYVTVGDVLTAVHKCMRTRIGEELTSLWSTDRARARAIDHAYAQRRSGRFARGMAELETRRRIDIMGGRTCIDGLAASKQPGHWELFFSAPRQ